MTNVGVTKSSAAANVTLEISFHKFRVIGNDDIYTIGSGINRILAIEIPSHTCCGHAAAAAGLKAKSAAVKNPPRVIRS